MPQSTNMSSPQVTPPRRDPGRWGATSYALLAVALLMIVADLGGLTIAQLVQHWVALSGGLLLIAALILLTRTGLKERGLQRSAVEDGGPPDSPLVWAGRQIAYYRSEVLKNVTLYTLFKIPAMLSAAALPVIALTTDATVTRWAAGVLGATITFLDGIQHLFRYRENWISAVQTREILEHEIQRYGVKAGPYQTTDPDKVLVERVSAIIAEEYSSWVAGLQNQGSQGQPGPNEQELSKSGAGAPGR